MKKKLLSVLLIVLTACLLLAGCKKNVGTPEDNAVQDTETEEGEDEEQLLLLALLLDSDYQQSLGMAPVTPRPVRASDGGEGSRRSGERRKDRGERRRPRRGSSSRDAGEGETAPAPARETPPESPAPAAPAGGESGEAGAPGKRRRRRPRRKSPAGDGNGAGGAGESVPAES